MPVAGSLKSPMMLLLVLALSVPTLGQTGNYINYTSTSAASLTVTSGPSDLNSSRCADCLVFLPSAFNALHQWFWYNSTVGITLDTVFVTTTLYNNTSVLNTRTIYGDLSALTDQVYRGEKDTSLIAEVQSIVTSAQYNGPYGGGDSVAWTLVNGTDAGGASIPYPTPYYEVSELVSCKQNGPCTESCKIDLASAIEYGHYDNKTETAFGCSTTEGWYHLEKPYFQTITDTRFTISDFGMPHWQGVIDTVSFKSWVAADRRLMSLAPDILSCYFFEQFDGPPGFKIPVSALTATSGITVTGAYSATSRTPAPASQPTQSTVHATPKPSQTPSPTTSQSKSTAEEDGHTQQGHESAIESSHTIIDHAPSTWIASSEETTKTIGTNMPASNPVLTLGGSQYTRNSQSEIILPGLTLKPGQAATVSNTPISFDSAGSYAIVGTKTQSLTPAFAPDAPEAPAVLTIQGASYTVDQDSNHFVINGMTLHPGSTITVAGTPVALGPDGSYAVVGTKTQPLTVATLNGDAAPVIIVAGTPYTQQSDSGYIIAGQTLSKGGKITVAGSVVSWVSVRKSAAGDFSAGHFITAAPVASIQPKPVLTFGGSTYTARPDSHDFVIDGQTLTQGGEITVSGVDISYPTDSYIVVGSSTQQLGATRAAKLTFAGSTFTADAHGDFVIDGQTLTQGGEITVSDVGISYPTGSYIVVGSSTQQLETTGAAELTFAGSTFTADAYGDFVVEGQTLKPGGVINIDGTAISYATDGAGVIIGSETEFFAVPTGQEPTITFEGSTYTAGAASDFVIGGQTLTPGSAITVDGVPLSYAADGHDVVVGSQTQYFATDADYGSAITFEGSTYTANAAGDFVIAGQTLTPGGVITVDGTPISYDADGKDVVVGSETQYLATGTELGAAITFEGSTYTANVAGDFVIAGQTLTPGGVITVDGTPISYDSDGKDVVVGSETQYLATGTEFGATITFEGSTYTANVAGDFVIAGETLTPGGVITVDGTPISYAADESDVVVGTSTEAVGLGSYIIGGFGSGFGTATTAGGSNYTGAVFAGRAAGQYDSLLSWRGVVLVGSVVIVSITL